VRAGALAAGAAAAEESATGTAAEETATGTAAEESAASAATDSLNAVSHGRTVSGTNPAGKKLRLNDSNHFGSPR
jgi:hypothetical protein